MQEVLQAVIPVFGLIWLGYFFKKINMPGDDFWPLAEKITYYVFLPSLFFICILKADFSDLEGLLPLLLAVTATSFLTSLVTFIVQYGFLKLQGKSFASFYQGSIRFNNYIGIPIILSLFGEQGLAIYAIIIGLSIPLTNILTVAVMSHYASGNKFSTAKLTESILKNPLIIGPFLGLLVNLSSIPLYYSEQLINFLANAATAVGLLVVGAAINFESIKAERRTLTIATILKLVINPVLMLLTCQIFGVHGLAQNVAIIYAALPVAASSYLLAKQFNADGALMSSIIVVTTLIVMLTMPIILLML